QHERERLPRIGILHDLRRDREASPTFGASSRREVAMSHKRSFRPATWLFAGLVGSACGTQSQTPVARDGDDASGTASTGAAGRTQTAGTSAGGAGAVSAGAAGAGGANISGGAAGVGGAGGASAGAGGNSPGDGGAGGPPVSARPNVLIVLLD